MIKRSFKGMSFKVRGIIIMVVFITSLIGTTTFANNGERMISVLYNNIKIVLDGKTIDPKDALGNTVEPFIYNGTTYMPVRAVAEAIGKTAAWNGKTGTVYLGNIDGNTPVENLTKLTVFQGSGLSLDAAGYTDNTGILHKPSVLIGGVYGSTAYSGTYLLNMKYSRLKGNLSLDSGSKNSGFQLYVNIYGDNKLIYTSNVITSGVYPQDFNVDVSGIVQLRFEVTGISRTSSWISDTIFIILSGLDLYN